MFTIKFLLFLVTITIVMHFLKYNFIYTYSKYLCGLSKKKTKTKLNKMIIAETNVNDNK